MQEQEELREILDLGEGGEELPRISELRCNIDDATPEERKAAAEFVKEQSEATAEINLGNPDEHK